MLLRKRGKENMAKGKQTPHPRGVSATSARPRSLGRSWGRQGGCREGERGRCAAPSSSLKRKVGTRERSEPNGSLAATTVPTTMPALCAPLHPGRSKPVSFSSSFPRGSFCLTHPTHPPTPPHPTEERSDRRLLLHPNYKPKQ